ncbi:glycosyltransferase [Halobacillus litoralis]|uniref:glycosyltransferase n=1 Tax=Halobacillus litoralis TaxID=45668 RepID=UPI001CFD755D|nr:glycosyltransferase [Halobacillus litoralis]WLR49142.1 glycosyltransferase [Halobacillus litoralis]
MKKRLLFIMPSLAAGGGEKSLINLLSQMDYEKYEIDLFLFNHEGIFLELVPEKVNILPINDTLEKFSLPLFQSLSTLSINKNYSLLYNRFKYALKNRGHKNTSVKEQMNWRHLSESIPVLDKEYDVAIGFLEKTSTYFCVDKVKSKKKIGWIHIDYDHLGMDPDFDKGYFDSLDHIVTVSEECAAILKRRFPTHKSKIEVIYNIVSPNLITKMADMEQDVIEKGRSKQMNILSVGRLHYQKGFDLSIKACRILVDKGYPIIWHIIGEGEERARLTDLIHENNLEDHFKLLGLKPNPYPYMKQADIYVQTSMFEGKSIAIDEAKILNKPILVTDFSTAKDQIENGVTGIIVPKKPVDISSGIEKLLTNEELTRRLRYNLSNESLGTESEINKIYAICD